MNNSKQNSPSPFVAAVIGGVAGALAIYLSDEKHRKSIKDKYQALVDEGKSSTDKLKSMSEKTMKSGRKTLAKKIRQVEKQVAKA